jgi:hypothetical protein
MPKFHETGYGRKFFTVQLPELIKALNKIADELKKQNSKKEEK